MRRSVHIAHRPSSKSPKSYEIFEDDDTDTYGRHHSQESDIQDEDIMEGLLDLIKLVKRDKYKQKRKTRNHREDSEYDIQNFTDHKEESKQRSLREKDYLLKEQKHVQNVHK